jgi:hypothetical protein
LVTSWVGTAFIYVIERKIEGRIKMTGKRGRRRRQLLDDTKEKRGSWKSKEEALYRNAWSTVFGRDDGPDVRPITE